MATKPAAGVMATSPTTAPTQKPTTDGFFPLATSNNIQVKPAEAAAVLVVAKADTARELAAKAVRYLTRNRKFDYWSNTYATAQVVAALVDFSKTGSELTPNYTYGVTLDGQQIAQGVRDSGFTNSTLLVANCDDLHECDY